MPFPVAHLRVADLAVRALKLNDEQTAALLLGSLAPDGVHYRAGLVGASQLDIGAAKKHSHLCPQSDERWGQVTDNEGWVAEVKRFYQGQRHCMLSVGYAVHVLTDIYNNMTLWKDFCVNHPSEAAKGYKSDYYHEMGAADLQLYQEAETKRLLSLLAQTTSQSIPNRVTAEEIAAIRDGILMECDTVYTSYVNRPPADTSANCFVTFKQIKNFVEAAAVFALQHLAVL
jgi:hypothetical protein